MLHTVCRSVASPLAIQVRGMATLKDIRLRLKSVKNIQKITQSMKMVSAAKYARAERDLKPARPYGEGSQAFYECTELTKDETKPSTLFVAMTSDRGLCGGIHSNVAKKIKAILAADNNPNLKVICVGDKARAILKRQYRNNIMMVFNEFGKKPPVFPDAVAVANAILDCGHKFDKGLIVYNRFKTVVSYKTTEAAIFSLDAINSAEKISIYDSLDAEVVRSFQEFSLASIIYYAMKENACSEQSSRMTAMDSATKNAGEMIDKLTLTFNRTRQAVITRELIEIISGAAAL